FFIFFKSRNSSIKRDDTFFCQFHFTELLCLNFHAQLPFHNKKMPLKIKISQQAFINKLFLISSSYWKPFNPSALQSTTLPLTGLLPTPPLHQCLSRQPKTPPAPHQQSTIIPPTSAAPIPHG